MRVNLAPAADVERRLSEAQKIRRALLHERNASRRYGLMRGLYATLRGLYGSQWARRITWSQFGKYQKRAGLW